MAVYDMQVPDAPEYDYHQELRDRRLEAIRQSLDWPAIRLQILERLSLDMLQHDGPLGEIVEMLTEVPIMDKFDLDGWLRWCGPRDAGRLGKALMQLIGETVLHATEAADHATF